ncbi:hypothetical protein PR048_029149 [Dryococelus australis]|uniref:Uncharacterized protein n=1 Tax=Dryococelus australis TaxID=614101 RepID=A0ABQ9GD62_9NEOP|nr:hypothetical protein PR048_029149 [Dryococelus australis]
MWRLSYPVDSITLRLLVHDFLDRRGKCVKKLKNDLPGREFEYNSSGVINAYVDEHEKELAVVQPSNIINYDESNFANERRRRKVIMRQ